ncbi:MAG TPA: energy transducer TonB [Gemmatimonadales bacterium]
MFGKLIETNARRQRSAGSTLASFVLHAALIGLAVAATANAGDGEPREEPEVVEFVDTPRPDEPPPPEPEPAPLPPDAVAAPPAPLGFPTLEPPTEVPDVIPEIDLSRPLTDESDFTGIGVPGGTRDGVPGAHTSPVLDPQRDFGVHEVERAVMPLDAVSPSYPAMLRSRGTEGRVVVRFVVDTTGRVEEGSIEVVESSHDLFTASVRRALAGMRFSPAEIGGRRVRQLVQQPFVFEIRE